MIWLVFSCLTVSSTICRIIPLVFLDLCTFGNILVVFTYRQLMSGLAVWIVKISVYYSFEDLFIPPSLIFLIYEIFSLPLLFVSFSISCCLAFHFRLLGVSTLLFIFSMSSLLSMSDNTKQFGTNITVNHLSFVAVAWQSEANILREDALFTAKRTSVDWFVTHIWSIYLWILQKIRIPSLNHFHMQQIKNMIVNMLCQSSL